MLSRRTENARATLFVFDQLLLAVAFVVAFALKKQVLLTDPNLQWETYLRLYVVAAPLVALTLTACGFYRLRPDAFPPVRVRSRDLLWGGFVAMAALILVGFMIKPMARDGTPAPPYSRAIAFFYMGLSTVALGVSRLLLRVAETRLRGKPDAQARVVVFGMSPRVLRMLGVFQRSPAMHVRVVGVAADTVPVDVAPRLATAEAMALLEQGRVDHVLVDAGSLEPGQLDEIAALADREGISVHITASIFPSTRLVPAWERLGGVPVLGFVSAELPFGARVAKRAFDIVVACAALLLLAPFMLFVALVIKLESAGPALFIQPRVGEHGRAFRMFKFRTMVPDAEHETGPTFASEDDPRCTRLGRLLRRWNIDELPQLFNVLRGDMSLVGPRPERPEFVTDFKKHIPRYAHKHWVKPGITGWAQVHGLRGASTSLEERVEHDLYYIENWSLMLDIRILVRTVLDGYVNAA